MPQQYLQEKLEKTMSTMEIGDKFISKSWMVTASILEPFLNLIGVDHPLFFSDEYAKGLGFKSRVSTGLLTFAQTMGVLYKSGLLRDGIYMGTDKCRHMLPVCLGDVLRGEVEILDKNLTRQGDRFIIRYKWQVRNQEERVVSEGDNTCMFPVPVVSK